MTRIHKKPGSTAWKKSIKKSASRMARDLFRLGDSKNGRERVLKSYFKNKTWGEKIILKRLIAEAEKRRASLIGETREMEKYLTGKDLRMRKGVNLLVDRYNRNKTIENAGAVINSLKLMVETSLEHISKLENLEKNVPKREGQEIRWTIRYEEHNCVYLLRKLLKVEKKRYKKEIEQ